MQDWNAVSEEVFRAEAVRFIDRWCPAAIRHHPHRLPWKQARDWYLAMGRHGWLAPAWPGAWGGMGLDAPRQLAYLEEWERQGAPLPGAPGIAGVGPLLLRAGTDAQRAAFLPPILRGEHRWCLDLDGPDAGAAPAAMPGQARQQGGHWVVSGRMRCTSDALDANHLLALVQAGAGASATAGPSLLLVPLEQHGVTVRPVCSIAGSVAFCEVLLDAVDAGPDGLVGEAGKGWELAQAVQGGAPLPAGARRRCEAALARLLAIGTALGQQDDPVFRARHAQLELDVLDLGSAYRRACRRLREGSGAGVDAALVHVWAAETCQRIADATLELVGTRGGLAEAFDEAGATADLATPWLQSQAALAHGGQVQEHRRRIASQALQLSA